MSEIYFERAADIGTLYLEHIFYEFEGEPILFTCTDDVKNTYLCLCSDIRYEQKWIVVQCGILQLKALIEEETDIASVFLSAKKAAVISMDLQGKECSYMTDINCVDRLDLPEEGISVRREKIRHEMYSSCLTDISYSAEKSGNTRNEFQISSENEIKYCNFSQSSVC